MNTENKEWLCHGCSDKMVEVGFLYEEQYCCSGLANQCGCMGFPINPVFCESCESQIFRKEDKTNLQKEETSVK